MPILRFNHGASRSPAANISRNNRGKRTNSASTRADHLRRQYHENPIGKAGIYRAMLELYSRTVRSHRSKVHAAFDGNCGTLLLVYGYQRIDTLNRLSLLFKPNAFDVEAHVFHGSM